MLSLGRTIRDNGLFYILVVSYGVMIFNMTSALWFGDGVNIFATYTDAATLPEVLIDHNKVYWSKTSFLFLTLLLLALNVDFRAAAGLAAVFWSSSLIVMFGGSPTLAFVLLLGVLLISQQIMTKRFFGKHQAAH